MSTATPKVSAKVRIRVLVEIDAPGWYDGAWRLGDMAKQAKHEAIAKLRNRLDGHDGRIVGEPVLETIVTAEVDPS